MAKANETVVITPTDENLHLAKRISWTAIFTGAIVGIGLSFLLGLLGGAIGLSIFNVSADNTFSLALSGSIGVFISMIISMLAAGYTAGYLGRLYCPRRNLGTLYGFTTWVIILILSAILTAHMGSYVASYSNAAPTQAMNTAIPSQPSAANTSKSTTSTTPTSNSTDTAMTSPSSNQPNPVINGNQIMIVHASPGALIWGAFLIFGFFFIGALFCCIGAKWGMRCKQVN